MTPLQILIRKWRDRLTQPLFRLTVQSGEIPEEQRQKFVEQMKGGDAWKTPIIADSNIDLKLIEDCGAELLRDLELVDQIYQLIAQGSNTSHLDAEPMARLLHECYCRVSSAMGIDVSPASFDEIDEEHREVQIAMMREFLAMAFLTPPPVYTENPVVVDRLVEATLLKLPGTDRVTLRAVFGEILPMLNADVIKLHARPDDVIVFRFPADMDVQRSRAFERQLRNFFAFLPFHGICVSNDVKVMALPFWWLLVNTLWPQHGEHVCAGKLPPQPPPAYVGLRCACGEALIASLEQVEVGKIDKTALDRFLRQLPDEEQG